MLTGHVYNNANSEDLPAHRLEKLVVLAQQNDSLAFSQIYDLYFNKIFNFIFFRVSHKEVAEDLTEDVFVKAYRSIKKLQKTHSFESWIYQIARNKVIDYYRQKKSNVPLEYVENTLEYETNLIDTANLQINQTIFLEVLKQLPSDQQAVIRMKYFEDLTNNEIATNLDKTEGAVRVIQHRAISKLKILIDEHKK